MPRRAPRRSPATACYTVCGPPINFAIPAQTVVDLYRYRWQVELFFKWIKQHLRIKSFFGTPENAVKSQI